MARSATTWKKGQGGKGSKTGAREAVSTAFLRDLKEKWETAGRDVLDRLAQDDPATFVRVVASVIPKDVNLNVQHNLADVLADMYDRGLTHGRTEQAATANPALEGESPSVRH